MDGRAPPAHTRAQSKQEAHRETPTMAEATTLTIRLHAADNVVVARTDILPGTEIPAKA